MKKPSQKLLHPAQFFQQNSPHLAFVLSHRAPENPIGRGKNGAPAEGLN